MDWLAFELPCEGKSNRRPHVRDFVRRDAPTCGLTECLFTVQSRLSGSGWEHCVVVDDRQMVHGLLSLTQGTKDEEARYIMDARVRTFRPYADVKNVAEAMRKDGLDRAVVTNSDGQLLGVLLRADVAKATKELNDW